VFGPFVRVHARFIFFFTVIPQKRSAIAKTSSKQENKIFSPSWFGFDATSDEANKIK